MNELQKSFIESTSSFLIHYNHNHDKLGRFAKSNGSGSSGISELNSNSREGKEFIKEGNRAIRKEKIKKALRTSPSENTPKYGEKHLNIANDVLKNSRVKEAERNISNAMKPFSEYYNNNQIKNAYDQLANEYTKRTNYSMNGVTMYAADKGLGHVFGQISDAKREYAIAIDDAVYDKVSNTITLNKKKLKKQIYNAIRDDGDHQKHSEMVDHYSIDNARDFINYQKMNGKFGNEIDREVANLFYKDDYKELKRRFA